MNKKWKYNKVVIEGENFSINGLNIWSFEWKTIGERIDVKDPIYVQDYTFDVYEITDGFKKAKFATGEFSNRVWGIYLQNDEEA